MGPGGGELPGAVDYEELLDGASSEFAWPDLDEDQASAMCYTSGTTGHPKGVVYSHRSMVMHSYMIDLAETIGITHRDAVLPVVPMFHANAWGLPYAATMAGAKHVFAGQFSADPATLADLTETERVSVLAGVPTSGSACCSTSRQNPRDMSSIRYITAGGSAVPTSLIERFDRQLGVQMVQGWGMTETGPVASLSWLTPELERLPAQERFRQRAKQGRPVPGVRARVIAEDGTEVPWDGKSMGEIQVRGNWVAATYYEDPDAEERFADGWLRTGDVAVVDEHGYLHIVDRTKDLVKSGGEWISSVELESALMGHPAVLEAAVVGVPHERWDERPVACVVLKPDATATERGDHRSSWHRASRSGGCPTTSCSWPRSRRRAWGSSTRRSCARTSRATGWRDPPSSLRRPSTRHGRARQAAGVAGPAVPRPGETRARRTTREWSGSRRSRRPSAGTGSFGSSTISRPR